MHKRLMRLVPWFLVGIFLITFPLNSCTNFSPEKRDRADSLELPAAYSYESFGLTVQNLKWWESFQDKQLSTLVEQALISNMPLQGYWARLEQANALAAKTGAELYPSVSGNFDATQTRLHTTDNGSNTRGTENYSLGFIASYELDIWGRVKATRDSAQFSAVAAREDFNAAAITMAAEVTNHWVRIISQRLQHKLLEKQLHVNDTYLELVELRFKRALSSALDVFQQRQLVEKIKSQLPLIEQQERLLLQELLVLLGKPPQSQLEIERDLLPDLISLPPTGIPSDLLEYRPDIRGAFRRLEAADHQLSAARADRLPALRLTGTAALEHDDLDRLLDNWLLKLLGSLTAPIIDGAKRKAEVLRVEGVVKEKAADYRQTVLTALREVESSLVREKTIQKHIDALSRQLVTAQNALDEARIRYINGLNDYLPVLTQLLSVQKLEQEKIERQTDLILARVDLYRALGGYWPDEIENIGIEEGISQ